MRAGRECILVIFKLKKRGNGLRHGPGDKWRQTGGIPPHIAKEVWKHLDDRLKRIPEEFMERFGVNN